MILVISGCREYTDYTDFTNKITNFIDENGKPELVIFGECRGTDKLSLRYMKENNLKYKIYYANWEKFGIKTCPIRNDEMISIGTHLIAFLSENSKRTRQIITYAKNKNIKTTIFYV